MPKRSSKPRDPNQLAAAIVAQATGDELEVEPEPVKNAAAVELGRLGGLKGGKARAEKLSPKKRSQIAKKAAQARWAKRDDS
ncbi:MAG: uncharacterized protein JWM72_1610 [Actinomycetia bacterium]|nr:uncharacterized protein [Actinomycetes bacterium]